MSLRVGNSGRVTKEPGLSRIAGPASHDLPWPERRVAKVKDDPGLHAQGDTHRPREHQAPPACAREGLHRWFPGP
jgi:hypothetical protein